MPEEIPVELQEEIMDAVDTFVHRTLRSTKRKYERRERRNHYQLLLNRAYSDLGDEVIDHVVGSEDVECNWGFMNSIDNDKLFFALKSLYPREQKIIKLKFYDNYTYDEISEVTGCQQDLVRQIIHRAISKLKRSME